MLIYYYNAKSIAGFLPIRMAHSSDITIRTGACLVISIINTRSNWRTVITQN